MEKPVGGPRTDVEETPQLRVFLAGLAGGGAERVCLSLCNGWVRAGLKVELLLAKAVGPYLPSLDSRIRVIDLKASRALTSFLPASRILRLSPNVPVLIFGFEYGFGLAAL